MQKISFISDKISTILAQLQDITLVAATKTRSVDEIKEAVSAGAKVIAENKIQEAEEKYRLLKDFFASRKVEYHFIGNLQKNKVKKAVAMFDLIQSLDSLEFAVLIDRRAREIDKVQRCLVQVNISCEMQKGGIQKENTQGFLKKLSEYQNISVEGLMCIPKDSDTREDSRKYFREMKEIFDKISSINIPRVKMRFLSMGMTCDYKVAIEEGSNMVRIGTGIFGERK